MAEIASYLKKQAYMLAMNDVFLLSLGAAFLIGLVVLLTVRSPHKQAPAVAGSQKQESEAFKTGGEAKKFVALHAERKETIMATTLTKEIAMKKTAMPQPPKRQVNRRALILPVIILALLIATGVGGYLIYTNNNFYSTDDAHVTGTMVNITPPTSGTLIDLNVQVGSFVSAKQIIGTVQPLGFAPVQHLVAPMDGVIVQVPAVTGQQVGSTTTVAQETDPKSMKITAYIDESAIKNIAPGQAVDVHIDAYNTTVSGHVSQIIDSTAGQFSLLPTSDNSSGNYTKVSQRIPVYIQLDIPDGGSLSPGMSVEVTIHLH